MEELSAFLANDLQRSQKTQSAMAVEPVAEPGPEGPVRSQQDIDWNIARVNKTRAKRWPLEKKLDYGAACGDMELVHFAIDAGYTDLNHALDGSTPVRPPAIASPTLTLLLPVATGRRKPEFRGGESAVVERC